MINWFLKTVLPGARVERRTQLDAGGSEHGYDPNQPRVPAGHPDGGQWTSTGGASTEAARRPARARSLDEIIRDAIEDASLRDVYAAVRPRPGPIIVNGRPVQATPRQAAELAAVEAQARERFSELQSHGIGPGPFFREGFPARGPDRNFYSRERQEVNRMFFTHGCHTCGTREPGTPSGNAVLDHQPPTGFNPLGRRQYLLPHCLTCSLRQGGWIRQNRNKGLR